MIDTKFHYLSLKKHKTYKLFIKIYVFTSIFLKKLKIYRCSLQNFVH
jgi:hypothetical protein